MSDHSEPAKSDIETERVSSGNGGAPASRTSGKSPETAALGAQLPAQFAASFKKVDKALALEDPVRMVHEARKAIKQYRALLRLVGTAQADAARRTAAATARELSSARDRQARRDAIAALVAHKALSSTDGEALLEALGLTSDPSSAPADHAARLRAWLGDARAQHAAELDRQAVGSDVLKQLRRAYQKARDAGRFAHAEDLHELRKRVVTHRYQMSFVANVAQGKGTKRAQRAQALRDLLGLMQDIETLGASLASAPSLSDGLRRKAEAASRKVQKEIVAQARDSHRSLFRRPAKSFGRRLAARLAGQVHI